MLRTIFNANKPAQVFMSLPTNVDHKLAIVIFIFHVLKHTSSKTKRNKCFSPTKTLDHYVKIFKTFDPHPI
jgi:hypothetical protein